MKIRSNYLLRILKSDFNPFTPNNLLIHNDRLEFKRRNSHLISVDSEELMFDRISGIDIDKHIFGATLTIKSVGSKPIKVEGLSKANAEHIKQLWLNRDKPLKPKSTGLQERDIVRKLEQLYHLKEKGAITESEYDKLKSDLLQ